MGVVELRLDVVACDHCNSNWGINEGAQASWGPLADGVYGGFLSGTAANGTLATSVELTTAWNVNAAYEHFWTRAGVRHSTAAT